MSRPAIDSHDATGLRGVSLRTRLVRLTLGLTAVGLVAAAAASARSLEVHPRGLLPTGTTGVIIADLSLSIGEANYQDMRAALQRVVAANEPIGLVVFSDVPYELLPPGTPAKELRPILRLLAPRSGRLAHPWQQGFRAGTRISQSLELARFMLRRDGISPGSILLLSDLETAPDDIDAMARSVQRLKREGIRVRIVPLAPSREGLELFTGLLGQEVLADPGKVLGSEPDAASAVSGKLPVTLLILSGLCLAALAAQERFGARLALPRVDGEGGRA